MDTAIIFEGLWRNALGVIPLVLAVAIVCRVVPMRASTRHLLWTCALLSLLIPPIVPRLNVEALLPDAAQIGDTTETKSVTQPIDNTKASQPIAQPPSTSLERFVEKPVIIQKAPIVSAPPIRATEPSPRGIDPSSAKRDARSPERRTSQRPVQRDTFQLKTAPDRTFRADPREQPSVPATEPVSSPESAAPATADELWLLGAGDLLHRAVFNLVLNGVQWAGEGGKVLIVIDDARSNLLTPEVGELSLIRLTVADSGPGVPPERIDTIFNPFVTFRSGGSGLGLALVQRAVEAHGGAIFVDATPSGSGAMFTLYLPAIEREMAERALSMTNEENVAW